MPPSFRPHHRPAPRGEQVDVTIDGKTRTVEIPAERRRAPADWDRWRSTGSTAGTAAVVLGALGWSVYAIGSLLSALAPPALAYGIAAVFDLAWIMCMNYEYELRFQPQRQLVPRVFGWLLLAVSVAVILLHGVRVADPAVAVAGSVIAVLAKILWHLRVHIARRDLNPATQAWLDGELDDAEAALLVLAARRRINRAQARAGAELAALDVHPGARGAAPVPHPVQLEGAQVHRDVPPPGERRRALAELLAQIPADDPRGHTQLARDLGPRVGLTEGSARNAIRDWANANTAKENAQ